jgi:hypothetical protein
MEVLVKVGQLLLSLSILIVLHELGHFICFLMLHLLIRFLK